MGPRASSFRLIASVACLTTAGFLAASCDRGPKRALRLNLRPGSVYLLTVRTAGETKLTDATGKEMKLPAASENRFTLRPETPDAQGDIPVSVEPGKSVFPFVAPQISAAFEKYKFGMKLTPLGRVKEFSNLDAARTGIAATLTERTADAAIALSDDGIRAIIEQVTAIWPTVPVAPGDEWTRGDVYIPASDTIESAKFRLKSWDDSGAVIIVETATRPAGRNTQSVRREFNGKGKGEIHIAPADGTIRSLEISSELSGTITDVTNGNVTKLSGSYRLQAELNPR